MSAYRPPYISFHAFTWDRPDNELRPVWFRLDCWTETWNYCTGVISYRSHVNDNKSQAGSRNCKPVRFLGQRYTYLTRHVISSWNQVPSISSRFHINGCKNFILIKVHTSLSSSRSHVNTQLCADQLETSASPPRANLGCLPTFDLVWVCVWGGENWAGSVRFQTIFFFGAEVANSYKTRLWTIWKSLKEDI